MISRHQEKGKDVVGDEGAQVMDEDDNHANSNETTIIPEIDHCINQHEPITSTTTPKIHPSSSNPLVSLTSALLHPLVSLSLQQQQTNWKVNTSDHTVLPMDHSIKSGALFSSQDPAIIECLATLDINSVGSQMKQVGIQVTQ